MSEPSIPTNPSAPVSLQDALTTPFSLSVLTATKGHASKRLVPDVAGKPIRDPEHKLGISAGRVEHVQVPGLVGLADLLQQVTSKRAFVHGVPIDSAPGDVFRLVIAEKFTGAPGTIARTKACIQYPLGPHLLMLDRELNVRRVYRDGHRIWVSES